MATRAGRDVRATDLLACDHVCYLPLGGELHTENGCRHGKYLKMRRYSEGLCCFFPAWLSCTVIRRAFCIVPVQASGIFGQVPLSPAPVIPSCVYHAARACALIHLQLRTRLSPLLNYLARDSSLTLSPLSLSTSLSSSPLPSVSFSQRTLTPEHARFNITSASSGRKHRGHSLPFLFFHPPTFPLGTAPCTA